MRLSVLIVIVLSALLCAHGCRNNDGNPVDGGNTPASTTVVTTIAGVMVGDGVPSGMAGAVVTAHGRTTTVDANGFFMFEDISVPKDRCVVSVVSDGHLVSYRAETPVENGTTHMMMHATATVKAWSFTAQQGTVLSELRAFVAPGIIVTDSGRPYQGSVEVVLRAFHPMDGQYAFPFLFMPGDYTGERIDGSRTYLQLYSMARLRLQNPAGEPLRLADTATVNAGFSVLRAQHLDLPPEVPVWKFDTTAMIWKEHGIARLDGDVYKADISLTGDWMVALPVQTATLEGRVSCGGKPAPNVVLEVGQRLVLTDGNGNYRVKMPANATIRAYVSQGWSSGAGTATPVQVGPLAAGETAVQNIDLTTCPAYVSGRVVGCDGTPVRTVVHAKGPGAFVDDYSYAVADGGFSVRVEPGKPLTVTIVGKGGGQGRLNISAVAAGTTVEAGTIVLCDQPVLTAFDVPIGKGTGEDLAFSYDASRVALTGSYGAYLVDVQNHTVDRKLTSTSYPYIAFDGPFLIASTDQKSGATLWNAYNWQLEGRLSSITSCLRRDDETVYALSTVPTGAIVLRSINMDTEVGRIPLDGVLPYRLLGFRDNRRELCYTTSRIGTSDHRIMFWTIGGPVPGREIIVPYHAQHRRARLSFDGNLVAVPTFYHLLIYDAATTKLVNSITLGHKGEPVAFAFAPDGEHVVLQHVEQEVPQAPGVYSIATGARVAILAMPEEGVRFTAFAFSRTDGKYVAGLYNNGEQGAVRIWELP